MSSCAAGGSCVEQQDLTATPIVGSMCFDNGVKILVTDSLPTSYSFPWTTTWTYQVKKGDVLCYTRTFVFNESFGDGGQTSVMNTTLQDPSGATVVTASVDENDVATVTCPGSEPTVFTYACGYPSLAVNGAFAVQGGTWPACTQGSCGF